MGSRGASRKVLASSMYVIFLCPLSIPLLPSSIYIYVMVEVNYEPMNDLSRTDFSADGCAAVRNPVLDTAAVDCLNASLERAIRGDYDPPTPERSGRPDKPCRLVKLPLPPSTEKPVPPLGFSGNHDNVRTLQIVNVWKCSRAFEALVKSRELGKMVAKITNWPSVRVAQDQTWLKPPSASGLGFHRDRGYFMFKLPPDAPKSKQDSAYLNGVRVVTVWIALDDMDDDIGPLEYARGSHRWGRSNVAGNLGTNSKFFVEDGDMGSEGIRHLALQAARKEGLREQDVTFMSMAGIKAGGLSVHDGDTWHGSGPNRSRTRCRRGIGIHYVRADVRWDLENAQKSSLWRPYVTDTNDDSVCEKDFPIVWTEQDTMVSRAEEEQSIRTEQPSLKTACKNFMCFKLAETVSGAAGDAASNTQNLKLLQVMSRFILTEINSKFEFSENDDSVHKPLLAKIRKAGGKPSDLFSRSFVRNGEVRRTLLMNYNKGADNSDEQDAVRSFIEEFVDIAVNSGHESSGLVWTTDLQSELKRRASARLAKSNETESKVNSSDSVEILEEMA